MSVVRSVERRIPRDPYGAPLEARWRLISVSRFTGLETRLDVSVPFGEVAFMQSHLSKALDHYYPGHAAILRSANWLNEHLFAGLLDDNGRLLPGVK